MARSGLSDRIVINDQDGEATWEPQKHLIERRFTAIHLHLSGGGGGVRGEIGFIGLHFNLSR